MNVMHPPPTPTVALWACHSILYAQTFFSASFTPRHLPHLAKGLFPHQRTRPVKNLMAQIIFLVSLWPQVSLYTPVP